MREYKEFTKIYLTRRLKPWRENGGSTQEEIAEILRMSSRSYANPERGKNGFSSTTLLLFLAFLPN